MYLPGDKPNISQACIELERNVHSDYNIVSLTKQYIPKVNDVVIGIVTKKVQDGYKLDIGCYKSAYISFLAFQESTLQNYPDYQPGTKLLCGLVFVDKNCSIECSCQTGIDKKSFETGETYLGELKNGTLQYIGIVNANILVGDHCAILYLISKYIAFQIAVGLNGLIYVNATDKQLEIVIVNTIINCISIEDYNLLKSNIESLLSNYIIQVD